MASFVTMLLLLTAICMSACALHSRECLGETSSVTVTTTRLQVNEVPITITRMDVHSRYVTLTTTEYLPSLVTKINVVTLFAEPRLAVATEYVTDLNTNEKQMVYTSTNYVPETISIAYSGYDVDNIYEEVWNTFTSTSYDSVTLLETLTRSLTETLTRTVIDVSTSVTYVPRFVSETVTNVFPISQTVYQTEFVKHTTSIVKTETTLFTVHQCSTGSLQRFFGFRK